MRRIAASILMVASAICMAGIGDLSEHRSWLAGPAFLFFLLGVHQFSRSGEDDRKSS